MGKRKSSKKGKRKNNSSNSSSSSDVTKTTAPLPALTEDSGERTAITLTQLADFSHEFLDDPEFCAAEYLRACPNGLETVVVSLREIHEVLCQMNDIDINELEGDVGEPPDDESMITIEVGEAEALETCVMQSLPAHIAEQLYERFELDGCKCPLGCTQSFRLEEFEEHCLQHWEQETQERQQQQLELQQKEQELKQHKLELQQKQLELQQRETSETSETSEASAPQPSEENKDSVGTISEGQDLDSEKVEEPKDVATEEVEDKVKEPQHEPAKHEETENTEPCSNEDQLPVAELSGDASEEDATCSDSTALSIKEPPAPSPFVLSDMQDDVMLFDDNYRAHQDFIGGLLEEPVPIPEISRDADQLILHVLPRPPQSEDEVDDALENLLEWLYYDAEAGGVERWTSLFTTCRALNKRIADLETLMDRREQVLRIRIQVSTDYQEKLATMAPLPDKEDHKLRIQMVEILCIVTVLESYLDITRRRVSRIEEDLKRVSDVAKRIQENIVELGRQLNTFNAEIDSIDADELKLLQEELALVQEGRGKRRGMKSLESDKHRAQKDELVKKIDHCKRNIGQLKDQYSGTLTVLVKTKEKLHTQQCVFQSLQQLQVQCHEILDAHDKRSDETRSEPIRHPTTADLQPIVAFEQQETEDLERLVDEHRICIDERHQIIDLMREFVYSFPIVKAVRDTILMKLNQMAHETRLQLAQQQQAAEQNLMKQREEVTRALIETEEHEKEKQKNKERAKKLAAEKREEKRQQEREKVLQEERRKREIEEREQAERERKAEEEREREREEARRIVSSQAESVLRQKIQEKAQLKQQQKMLKQMQRDKEKEPEPAKLQEVKKKPTSSSKPFHEVEPEQEPQISGSAPNGKLSRRAREKQTQQLCRDFLRGSCPRGESCTWLHVTGNTESQPLCKDFQRGVCHRKPCAFLHLTPKEAAAARTTMNKREDAEKENVRKPKQPSSSASKEEFAAAATKPGKSTSHPPPRKSPRMPIKGQENPSAFPSDEDAEVRVPPVQLPANAPQGEQIELQFGTSVDTTNVGNSGDDLSFGTHTPLSEGSTQDTSTTDTAGHTPDLRSMGGTGQEILHPQQMLPLWPFELQGVAPDSTQSVPEPMDNRSVSQQLYSGSPMMSVQSSPMSYPQDRSYYVPHNVAQPVHPPAMANGYPVGVVGHNGHSGLPNNLNINANVHPQASQPYIHPADTWSNPGSTFNQPLSYAQAPTQHAGGNYGPPMNGYGPMYNHPPVQSLMHVQPVRQHRQVNGTSLNGNRDRFNSSNYRQQRHQTAHTQPKHRSFKSPGHSFPARTTSMYGSSAWDAATPYQMDPSVIGDKQPHSAANYQAPQYTSSFQLTGTESAEDQRSASDQNGIFNDRQMEEQAARLLDDPVTPTSPHPFLPLTIG